MNIETAGKNIKEFIEKYGIEGFLKLYFSKYLLKLLISELKSKVEFKFSKNLSRDPGTIFYYKGHQIEKLSDIHKYEDELYEECKKMADEIITEFKKDKKFNDLFRGNLERLNDTLLEKHFEKKLHEILEDWREED